LSKALIISLLFLYSCTSYKDEIKNNQALTTAKVVGQKLLDVRSGYSFKYEYTIDNETYTGFSGEVYCDYSHYAQKNIPLVYSTENPNFKLLLLHERDFTEWGYEFHDSLKWLDCHSK